jgi:CubicO group peptidase (beta-lactamase class C family)
VSDPNALAFPYLSANPRPARMTDPQSMPFGADAIVFSPARIFNPGSYPSGGVGMVGTAADYLAFLEMLRQGGGNVLTPETASAATSNQIAELPVAFAPGWGFGFGFAVMKEADASVPWSVGTWRWIGGYGSHFWVDPNAKLSVVVLTNTTMGGALGPFPDALRNAIYGFVPSAPSPSRQAPAPPAPQAPAVPPASDTAPEPPASGDGPAPEPE